MDFRPKHGSDDARPSRWGYLFAILVSAGGHALLFFLMLVVIPALFTETTPPPAYTVKIVDSIPAGDLGTHLPDLSARQQPQPTDPQPSIAEAEEMTPAAQPSPPDDADAIALNTHQASVTPTPTPTPTPTEAPTVQETPEPEPTVTPTRTARPTPRPKRTRVRTPAPTIAPTPARASHRHNRPAPTPKVMLAAVQPTPGVRQRLDQVREQLMKEHLKEISHEAGRNPNAAAHGGGPVLASTASSGKGYGVGPGTGSAGIEEDPGFLLYYQAVQKKIRANWSFSGDNPDLTATVTFGINPDGSLNSIRVTASSRDPSFDDSVVRAIRRAAPFPPTPDRYRGQFAEGLPAIFKLGDLAGANS
jgi:TonB family protein